MKILNHYNELRSAIDTNDTNRFENLLCYSDCRKELINKYIQNYGIENINKMGLGLQARALKNEIKEICLQCEETQCRQYNSYQYKSKKDLAISSIIYMCD